MALRVSIVLLLLFAAAASAETIELRPAPGQQHAAVRLRQVPAERLDQLRAILAAPPADQPVIVTLAGEDSGLARDVPPWVAGYAHGSAGVVVIFPQRATAYPHDGLGETFLHELAHIYIHRAAGGGEIPRWFHEAMALTLSTGWTMEDRGRTTYAMIRRWNASPGDVDRWLTGNSSEARRGYAIAEAFGRDFLQRYGPRGVQTILRRVREGVPFDRAFSEFTGRTVEGAWLQFWDDQTFVHRTIPLISSGTVLWLCISLLAIAAFRRRRHRDALMHEMWDAEEELLMLDESESDEETVH